MAANNILTGDIGLNISQQFWDQVEEDHLRRLKLIKQRSRARISLHKKRKRALLRRFLAFILLHLVIPQRTCWVRPRHLWWNRTVQGPAVNLRAWTNREFRENLRMNRHTFERIVDLLAPYIYRRDTKLRKAISVQVRVAISVWRLATNVEFRTLSHLFGVGLSTAAEITKEVCHVLWTNFRERFIRFPSGDRAKVVIDGFQKDWNFPQCIGAIDGTHIPINGSENQHTEYYNRKGNYSIVVQAVVDNKYRFTSVNVGWPGSVHDARVYANSKLYRKCSKGKWIPNIIANIGGTLVKPVIIGDAAYPLSTWLIKPFGGNLTRDQEYFNYRLSRARMTAENGFGRLKSRFRILSKRNECSIPVCKEMIGACLVLHNICEEEGDGIDQLWVDEFNAEEQEPVPIERFADPDQLLLPNQVRLAFMRHCLQNRI